MAELWAALRDGSLTCLDRLKVASYLWKQESARNKNWSLLLTWAFEEICKAYNRRAKSHPPEDVRCKLWQLLSVMLESITTSSGVELWEGEASPSTHLFQVCGVDDPVPCHVVYYYMPIVHVYSVNSSSMLSLSVSLSLSLSFPHLQSMCDALNGASTPDSDTTRIQTAGQVLKCLHSILNAAELPPVLHKFETVVRVYM